MTREEAINTLARFKIYINGGGAVDRTTNKAINMAIEALGGQKTGEWSYTTHYGDRYRVCNNCHTERKDDLSSGWNYCPYCGAKMNSD